MRQLGQTVILALLLTGGSPATDRDFEQAAMPDETARLQRRLAESLEVWQQLKAERGDTYRYSVRGGFLTFYDLTTITVRSGKVTARAYAYFERNDEDEWVFLAEHSWTERGSAVGGRAASAAAAPYTLDELYKSCWDVVLTKNPRANRISLYIAENGVLSDCTWSPKGRAVDTAPGVSVSGLEFIK